ncbi:hypothetical protein HZY91_04050 [Facklamia sp. DSM 111018]|uniref:Uncharacterized protein n=1 Tax=Facklamia lactis TaxID=2749967 RepID=A0ABS0LPJ3_9LACT|nr:hypothetical protein [Facklamia lactis]MBG9980262.1 hypothetical protein [Facklamia lactis]MBG9986065.1 hypothetical protein [Facklamia lactis]
MNAILQKFVDDGLFNETVANYIEEAFANKESVVIAGHRSTGSRPLMANIMQLAKKTHESVQVRKAEDIEKEGEYYLVFGAPAEEVEGLVEKALAKGKAFVTLKEPETPISMLKVMKGLRKENEDFDHKVLQVSLRKDGTGAGATPFTDRVDRYFINEKGRVKSEKLDF